MSNALIYGKTSAGNEKVISVDSTGALKTASSAVSSAVKNEDAPAADGDAGLPILGVRNDSEIDRTGTDGDYGMLAIDSKGRVLVLPAATERHLGEIGGNLVMISTEFTRPADTTAYAANDVVSDSTSATTMQALANAARVSGGSGYIVGVRVATDKKSITPRIRCHFYNTTGVTLSADNAAWQDKYADSSKRIAYWDMPPMSTGADTTNSDMSRSVDMTMRIPYTCAATSLYYVLEALDAFTPASGEKFTVTMFVDRN